MRDAAKITVSESGERGCFLLTGSASPEPGKGPLHGGEGRTGFVRMRTMSLYEMGISNGSVSMGGLFAGKQDTAAAAGITLEGLARCVLRGGWPGGLGLEDWATELIPREYIAALQRSEIPWGTGGNTTAGGCAHSCAHMPGTNLPSRACGRSSGTLPPAKRMSQSHRKPHPPTLHSWRGSS